MPLPGAIPRLASAIPRLSGDIAGLGVALHVDLAVAATELLLLLRLLWRARMPGRGGERLLPDGDTTVVRAGLRMPRRGEGGMGGPRVTRGGTMVL